VHAEAAKRDPEEAKRRAEHFCMRVSADVSVVTYYYCYDGKCRCWKRRWDSKGLGKGRERIEKLMGS
jgi:hypothetical protein